MRNCILVSKIFLTLLLIFTSCDKATTLPFDYYQNYCVVQLYDTQEDAKWTDYLFRHLSKRAKINTLVSKDFPTNDNHVTLGVHIVSDANYDYKIEREREEITLYAKNENAMLWLIYQFIGGAAELDSRFDASDLPPVILNMESQEKKFSFEWRGLYSPSNSDKDMFLIKGTHHVDYDWALWGHNLGKKLGMKSAYYAQVDGKKYSDQFCFSSSTLRKDIESYIIDQFGSGKPGKGENITIMPNDNSIVCLCDDCKSAGNKKGNATPAVSKLIASLAERFPNHKFFTSAYSSTMSAPSMKMPSNVGVFISSVDVPFSTGYKCSKENEEFENLCNEWNKSVSSIYIWEYERNFDDYLTPFPCVNFLGERFRRYKELGVDGIFLNGAGDDYTTFDDLQSHLLTALMIDADCDIWQQAERFMKQYYPQTSATILEYYKELENTAFNRNKNLEIYGGIEDAINAYLDVDKFEAFWKKLDAECKSLSGDEKQRVGKLLAALNFTRLEIMRSKSKIDKEFVAEALAGLKESDIKYINESHIKLEDYIACWENPGVKVESEDHFLNQPVECSDDEAYMLTDGKYAFPFNYHTGWMRNKSNELSIKIKPDESTTSANNKIVTSFLMRNKWNMFLPKEIEVLQNGKQIGDWKDDGSDESDKVRKTIEITMSGFDPKSEVEIIIRRKQVSNKSTITCDEIELR